MGVVSAAESIAVTYESESATFATRPPHGRPVTFVVIPREVNVTQSRSSWSTARMATRYVVSLKGSTGSGFSHHTTYEAACKSALIRASRYVRAYSVPRGIEVNA